MKGRISTMKYNHNKAQKIYEELDHNAQIYNEIVEEMKKSSILPDFVVKVGKKISSEDLDTLDLENKVITVAEAIYKGFKENEVKESAGQYLVNRSDDELFTMVLDNLFYALDQEQFNSILGDIGMIYEVEI